LPETELYTKVIDFQNLFHAFRKAARGKRGHPEVAAGTARAPHFFLKSR